MAITLIDTGEKMVGKCGCLPVMMINGCCPTGPDLTAEGEPLNSLKPQLMLVI